MRVRDQADGHAHVSAPNLQVRAARRDATTTDVTAPDPYVGAQGSAALRTGGTTIDAIMALDEPGRVYVVALDDTGGAAVDPSIDQIVAGLDSNGAAADASVSFDVPRAMEYFFGTLSGLSSETDYAVYFAIEVRKSPACPILVAHAAAWPTTRLDSGRTRGPLTPSDPYA